MTTKSHIKLDARIRSMNDIQNVCSYNDNLVGCKGYFFNNFVSARSLKDTCHYGILTKIDEEYVSDMCFKGEFESDDGSYSFFRFFIPENSLVPVDKKYRPFTGTEFIEKLEFTLGLVIRFRDIHTRYEYKTVFSGYRCCDDVFEVFLNGSWIDMPTLLDTYECYEDNEWKKFGVEE